MTDATHMEARLMGLSKVRRKDGDWFEMKIQVHPEEMPNELYGVPLGTRIGVAMVQIADDERPVEPAMEMAKQGRGPPNEKTPFKDLPPAQQAGIRCNDPAFQEWILLERNIDEWPKGTSAATMAADVVRHYCDVESRAELNRDSHAVKWHRLDSRFLNDTHLPERR